MKIFSVIIPCYNCVNTLETTVNSIQASGLTDYEIILIDDGSDDGTGVLCDELCRLHTEIRCVHQKNAGVSAARNRGIDEAQGDYIWFVDADDTVDADSIIDAANIASQQQSDMLIFGMSFDYYHKGKLYRRGFLLPPHNGMLTPEQLKEAFQEFYNCNALSSVCNKFLKRNLLTDYGIRFRREMILMEDFLFVLDILPHCESIYCLKEAIYRYRQGEDEKGAYRRLQRIPDLAAFMEPIADGLKQLNIPDHELIAEKIYAMLFRQSLAYASLQQIQQRLTLHRVGKYAGVLSGKNACRIWAYYRLSHIRHRTAVFLKSRNMLSM